MKRSKRLTAMLFAFVMLISIAGSTGTKVVYATGSLEPTVPVIMLAEMMDSISVKPGDVIDLKIPIKAGTYYAKNPIVSIDLTNLPFELVSDFKLSRDDFDGELTSIVTVKTTYLSFQLRVKEGARKGSYELPLSFVTVDSFNNYCKVELSAATPITLKVTEERALPSLKIVNDSYPNIIKPEDTFDIELEFQNIGELLAKNVQVKLEGYDTAGLIPNFIYNTESMKDLVPGKSGRVSFNVTASKTLTAGVKTLTAIATYKTEDGTELTDSATFYIEALVEDKKETEKDPLLSLVSTSFPKTVSKDQRFDVSLTYKNTGKEAVKKASVKLEGYSESGFVPNFIYNTEDLKNLKPGESDTVSFNLTASQSFAAGVKNLKATVSYETKDETKFTETVDLYLEGISDDIPVTNSIPKLLIKEYETGDDKLMGGSIFNFEFDVMNSHSNARADNIKVTVASEDGTFSIIEGSSSFLIETILAGQTEHCMIPLQVKGDVATGGYDVTITFEYEYAALDENGRDISKSNTITEKLKLQVYANARPMVSNIAVGYWEMPIVNEMSTLTFEFYNMGKSPLYNVTASLEGDFQPNGDMLVIGNVEAGNGKQYEMDVTPLMEGLASGTLHFSYEDSNGNISTFDETFEQEVGASGGGGEQLIPGGDLPVGDFNNVATEKKEILPTWAFILVQAGVLMISIPLARKLVIRGYKKKMRAKEDWDD